MSPRDYELVKGEDIRDARSGRRKSDPRPRRLLVVQEEARPAVDVFEEDMVMTFPHLVVREAIALVALTLGLVVWSIFANAPLEEIANPLATPNPAKAPWYFLGLQELLHYYPPLVSGIILPGLTILALAVVPYFNVNLTRAPLWATDRRQKLVRLTAAIIAVAALFYVSGASPVWPIIGPTLAVGGLALLPGLIGGERGVLGWLSTRSLAFWIFVWFVVVAVTLTMIGIFFRGPSWSLTLPWVDGVYY
ncbi:MAG: hypothetical protein HY903_18930 [Deltaproteobacteria bacterium]|nr:hypothetical protein [Deltaproteobacteria bacterium]